MITDKTIGSKKSVAYTRATPVTKNLYHLPRPTGKIVTAVYNFKDQTGQYKPSTMVSSFSTAVSQGATSMLMQSLRQSKWFLPLERESLQNLLTERKISRAVLKKSNPQSDLPPLNTAQILMEGGIVGYNSNVRTGGIGIEYFGLGASEKYREDQVTVYLRAVDVRSGNVLASVSTSKTIYSQEVRAGLFRFISFKRLLEAETGYTENEPVQEALLQAIEKAIIGLIAQGIQENIWSSVDENALQADVFKDYINGQANHLIL